MNYLEIAEYAAFLKRAQDVGVAVPDPVNINMWPPKIVGSFVGKIRVTTGCWYWVAGVNSAGYGAFWNGKFKSPAHRDSYELWVGHLEEPKNVILHMCDNRRCVNPAHMLAGSIADNNLDKMLKGREAAPKGSQSPSSILVEAQVLRIRELYAQGLFSMHELAEQYGVSDETIRLIIHRLSWRHI